ncbi:MAG: methionyl-tRNA formyltransferase [Pseudomonadales bacterium]|nr:methionyl-tRNA formyltransferase [Pseudomonadales bacterium]
MNQRRIVFAGTPEFAAMALRALLQAGHQVVAVYSQPDRPSGRGRTLQPGPVKQVALEHDLPVCQPVSLRTPEALAELAAWQPDLMVVAAYGLLLPQPVLDLPPQGCLNIHASLLPRWRGAAPIQRALLAGDQTTGICIMQMDAGLDTGDVIYTLPCPITADDTSALLHDRLAKLGADALLQVLHSASAWTRHPQPGEGITYAHKLTKEEAFIDWSESAQQIDRRLRAYQPWPVAQTLLGDDVLRLHSGSWRSEVTDAVPGMLLKISREGWHVATGEGIMVITRIQRPGGKVMDSCELARARPEIQPGLRLGTPL